MGTGGKIKLEEGTAGGTYVGFKAPDTEITVIRRVVHQVDSIQLQ
jgi:hypothetical protein